MRAKHPAKHEEDNGHCLVGKMEGAAHKSPAHHHGKEEMPVLVFSNFSTISQVLKSLKPEISLSGHTRDYRDETSK